MKNNKGFSLVELIVVVLIMAIVAVALAPQVIKWVENSRIASDMETKANIENACKLAMTDNEAFSMVVGGEYEIDIRKDYNTGNVYAVCVGGGSDPDNDPFWRNFFKAYNCTDYADFQDNVVIKSTPTGGNDIEMTVYVYRGGLTFSTLRNFVGNDFDVS